MTKEIQKTLKEKVTSLFSEVEDDKKVRTRNDYFFEIKKADKINVLNLINKELEAFKVAKDSVKQGELLTKTRTNTITKEIKEIKKLKQNLIPQIKEQKIKRDELTLEQKTKREQKEVKKYIKILMFMVKILRMYSVFLLKSLIRKASCIL